MFFDQDNNLWNSSFRSKVCTNGEMWPGECRITAAVQQNEQRSFFDRRRRQIDAKHMRIVHGYVRLYRPEFVPHFWHVTFGLHLFGRRCRCTTTRRPWENMFIIRVFEEAGCVMELRALLLFTCYERHSVALADSCAPSLWSFADWTCGGGCFCVVVCVV